MTERPYPNYAFMAACCRHRAAGAEPSIKKGIEDAIAVLEYIEKHKNLMRAVAFFVSHHPEVEETLAALPAGTRIELNGFGPANEEAA